MLGGAEEIGANSVFLNLDGTGILVDAGLHPRERSEHTFPRTEFIAGRDLDVVCVTHAHTDHMGAVPYVLRQYPYARVITTRATRDLSHVMLHNTAKHVRREMQGIVATDLIQFYNSDTIDFLRSTFEVVDYSVPLVIRGYRGTQDVRMSYHWSGHILGSASILFEVGGKAILHTGDMHTEDQSVVPACSIPKQHVDVLVTESTNAASTHLTSRAEERKKLASFINRTVASNGSVLVPCFALGKLQEMIVLLASMMRRAEIPHIPLFTGGMGTQISKIYDQYCYSDPMIRPGFEISDIPQEKIFRSELATSKFLKEPSIVLASSGMVNVGTLSYELGLLWMTRPSFSIAFIGYQHPTTPGYQLLNSPRNESFDLAGRRTKRTCEVEQFRFSSHAPLHGLLDIVERTSPNTVVIHHGEPESCEALALAILDRYPNKRIVVPRLGIDYALFTDRSTALP